MTICFLFFYLFSIFYRCFYFYSFQKYEVSTDEAFHFYYIDLIKKNQNSLPDYNQNVLGEGPKACTYPSIYHFILSYFPANFLKKYGNLTALIYDFLTGTLLSLLLFKIYKIDSNFYFLITGIFLIFPSLIFPSIGPRSFSLTPRNFSQFLWSCSYLCLLCFLKDKSVFWLELSAILGSFNILSSKFFVQYILLMSIFISIFTHSIDGILFLINCLIFGIIIGRKRLYKQLKGHIEHSWWYINDGICFIQVRWQWSTIYNYTKQLRIRDLWQILMFQNPLTRGVILNLPLFLYIVSSNGLSHDPLIYFSYSIITGSIFYFILTQFSYFKAFGEPERYLEYSLTPLLFIIFYTSLSSEWISFLIIHCLIFCAYIVRVRKNNNTNLTNNNITEVIERLKCFANKRILCTSNNETYLFSTSEDKILLGSFVNNKKGPFYSYFYHVYPEVNRENFRSLVKEYDITHVIVNKSSKISKLYDTSGFNKIFENNYYKIYTL